MTRQRPVKRIPQRTVGTMVLTPEQEAENQRGYEDGYRDAMAGIPWRDTTKILDAYGHPNMDYNVGYNSGYVMATEDRQQQT